MSQRIEALRTQLAAANDALNAALAAGDDSAEFRYAITFVEQEIAALERQQREEKAAVARAEQAAVEQAAAELAGEAHQAIERTANVQGLAELTGEQLTLERDRAIEAYSRDLARCRAALERAENELKPLIEHANLLNARLAEKQAGVLAIKSRRATGEEREGDATELTLLQSDIQTLEILHGEARQKVTAADKRDAARAALSNAENALAHQQRLTTLAAAKARVELAERVLIDAANSARAAAKAVGAVHPSLIYATSSDLRRLVVGTY